MSLIYVTGNSGAGKSVVGNELRHRGHEAHDVDDDGFAVWVHCTTGVIMPRASMSERPAGWLEEQEWRMVPERVEELAARAEDRLAFLCGSTANDIDLWHLFAKVIYLSVDERTLRYRLETRTNNDFGKSAHEQAAILGWNSSREDRYVGLGAVTVDATQPLGDVVDDVLTLAGSPIG